MKTFKEIFVEKYLLEARKDASGKSPDFDDAVSVEFFEFASRVADEYKDQFCSCKQPAITDPSQLSLPLEHHVV